MYAHSSIKADCEERRDDGRQQKDYPFGVLLNKKRTTNKDVLKSDSKNKSILLATSKKKENNFPRVFRLKKRFVMDS